MCLRFDDFALKTALAMIFPYCWNRAWLESASKSFHVDASFKTFVFKMIRADREPSFNVVKFAHLSLSLFATKYQLEDLK